MHPSENQALANQVLENQPSSAPKPFYKNPYIIAGLIGIVLITISRPLMQNVPAPPPAFEVLAPILFETPSEGTLSVPNPEAKTLWVLYAFSPGCGPCEEISRQMALFAERAQRAHLDLRVLAVYPPSMRDFSVQHPLFTSAGLITPAHAASLPSSLFPALREAGPLVWFSPFAVLVDQQGLTRGLYACDDTGLDELFYRAKRLLPR